MIWFIIASIIVLASFVPEYFSFDQEEFFGPGFNIAHSISLQLPAFF